MFGLFSKKGKKAAKEFLSQAEKVYNYRRDAMPEGDSALMFSLLNEMEELILDGKAESHEFKKGEEKLESLMRKHGGMIYPLSSISDYVDTIIVAGILAIGIRSFFLQPFKIPTNSMYPSFYGMTSRVYKAGENSPALPEKIWRSIRLGAWNYNLASPADGELLLEINSPAVMQQKGGAFGFEFKKTKKFGFWPSVEREYEFLAGGKKVSVAVPADFNLDGVIMQAYPVAGAKGSGTESGDQEDIIKYLNAAAAAGKFTERGGKLYMKLADIKRGDRILNFDILGGDMLFVDRFTYNFRKPKVGEPIVFLTKYCEGMTRRNGGVPDDKYYIKRLVGEGGDTLQVRESTLYRNGNPAQGSHAFAKNAAKYGDYCGYQADGALADGATVKVSPKHYYAMGDNSKNSLDSRYWGEVPDRAVVGKSLIIFYPFTSRWGATK